LNYELAALAIAAGRFPTRDSYWRSIGTPAFNGNSIKGIVANKCDTGLFAADVIVHF
jgi:hypothetical protein